MAWLKKHSLGIALMIVVLFVAWLISLYLSRVPAIEPSDIPYVAPPPMERPIVLLGKDKG